MAALLAAALLLGQAIESTVYAPPDVPRDHWAFGAVNDSFKVGLLRGYPAKSKAASFPVTTVPFNEQWFFENALRWCSLGIWPANVRRSQARGAPNLTRDQLAEGLRRTCENAAFLMKQSAGSYKLKLAVKNESRSIARAVTMMKPELRRLGCDPEDLIKGLQEAHGKMGVRFGG